MVGVAQGPTCERAVNHALRRWERGWRRNRGDRLRVELRGFGGSYTPQASWMHRPL